MDRQQAFAAFAEELSRRVVTRRLGLTAAAAVAAMFERAGRYRVAWARDDASPTPEPTECFPFWGAEGLAVTPEPAGATPVASGTPGTGGGSPVAGGQPMPQAIIGHWYGYWDFRKYREPPYDLVPLEGRKVDNLELRLTSGGPGESVGCAVYGWDKIEGIPARCSSNYVMEKVTGLQPLTVRLRERVVDGPCVDGSSFELIVDGDTMYVTREGPEMKICRDRAQLERMSLAPAFQLTCPLPEK